MKNEWLIVRHRVRGVHMALAHLGRPFLAFRAFLGWRRSWLSREAIVFGLYMGSLVLLRWLASLE
ncbi:MAG: hypothetical protein SGI77_12525 [Pirellulaceae bacterium]|nr:hypothetical protein [Pirellulaceae bacterium]